MDVTYVTTTTMFDAIPSIEVIVVAAVDRALLKALNLESIRFWLACL